MLADYRARGGRIQQKNSDPFAYSKDVSGASSGKSGSKTEGDEEKGLMTSDAVWSTKVSKTTLHACVSLEYKEKRCYGRVKIPNTKIA